MAATFKWQIEMIQTDPTDDNFIKFILCGIYGTEGSVTKKTTWKVSFGGKKSDMPMDDWKSYAELMEGSGEAILIAWCKTQLGDARVAELEDVVQGYINIHNDPNLNTPKHFEAPANFSAPPQVTPINTNVS
tara:strand:- start:63 stop:458 length:396 start_codon:yes stop_codon:yes gene_type:complete